MNLFRTLSEAFLVCFTAVGLNGCINAPDYPTVPEIEFNSLQVGKFRPGNGLISLDTLKFAINFKDGDGDLGLSDEDIKSAPYNTKTGGHNNRGYSYNYFIQPFKKDASGNFVAFVNAPPFGFVGEYDGRYLRLDGADAKPAPLRGTLRYKLPLSLDGSSFSPGEVVRFEISIMDRALHESNKITTSEVKLGQ